MRPAKIFVNPEAGRGQGRLYGPVVQRYLAARGLDIELVQSTGPGDITRQVLSAARGRTRIFIVVGGDGSLSEAANGIMQSGVNGMLSVIPIGSGNDFSKALGVPKSFQRACDQILRAMALGDSTHRVDICRVNGRWFVNSLGIGFDAQVTQATRNIGFFRGDMIYLAALAKALWQGVRTPFVKLEHDHGVIEQAVTLISACNGQWVGGKFHMAPEALIDDGKLDVVLARPLSRFQILRLVPKVMRGQHLTRPEVRHFRTQRLRITTSEPVLVEADGEMLDEPATELEVEIIAGGLQVLV